MVFKNDCGKSDSVFKNMENLLNSGALIRCLAMLGGKISRKNTNLKTKLLGNPGERINDYDLKNSLEKLTEKNL